MIALWESEKSFLCNLCTSSTDCGSAFASGVYRSLDRGNTWQPIGGPDGMNDRRFSALPSGCGTNIIYIGNGSTNLYKGIDHFPSMDASNVYAPTKYVLRGRQEKVNVTVALSSTPTAVPDEITYELGFDPTVLQMDIDQRSDWKLPKGWNLKNAWLRGDRLYITLANSGAAQLRTSFG